jgi:hypothetical protein
MNKIPTAEEFVRSRFQNSDKADFESNKRNVIEFAKLHVEAAQEAWFNKIKSEGLETDVECAWILNKFDSTPNKNNFHQYTPYQLCPKCYGDGNLLRYNSPNMMSTTSSAICDVCNGNKIITMSK